MVAFDFDVRFVGNSFESLLAGNCGISIGRVLAVVKDMTTGVVDKDAAAGEACDFAVI